MYFDSFGIEYISQEVLTKVTKYLEYKKMILIMRGFYCIVFIDYMLTGKKLLRFTNLLSLNDYKKNEKNNV